MPSRVTVPRWKWRTTCAERERAVQDAAGPNRSRPRHLLAARFELPLFAILLSGLMSLRVSGVAAWKVVGLGDAFVPMWLSAWSTPWVAAFPVVMLVAPLVLRIFARPIHRQH